MWFNSRPNYTLLCVGPLYVPWMKGLRSFQDPHFCIPPIFSGELSQPRKWMDPLKEQFEGTNEGKTSTRARQILSKISARQSLLSEKWLSSAIEPLFLSGVLTQDCSKSHNKIFILFTLHKNDSTKQLIGGITLESIIWSLFDICKIIWKCCSLMWFKLRPNVTL